MESIYLLIPVSVLLVFGIAIAFWWSVRSGQFDDLEGPGFRVLMDDQPPPPGVAHREPDEANADVNAEKADKV
ncbi:MAG: cbb3-type cytochrome oxidase assembly protein CcoS [Azonexus sp.]